MNILIITLGNSEIQFTEDNLEHFKLDNSSKNLILTDNHINISVRRNNRIGRTNWLMPVSSREDGQVILENYNVLKDIIRFPIVESLIKFIKNEAIQKFYLVVTNQDDPIHKKGDTINYGYIVRKYFSEQLKLDEERFSIIEITQNVRDIDFQYKNFKKLLPDLLEDIQTDTNITLHLFAQGGIDQINHALTLQLLRKHKSNVHIYQKAEDEELKEIQFPQLFLKDLNREKIIKHLEDYDFDKAGALALNDAGMSEICQYADLRLKLNTAFAFGLAGRFNKNHAYYLGQDLVNTFKINWNKLSFLEKNTLKIQDLVYSIRIQILQKNYSVALIKLFTLFENLFKLKVEELSPLHVDTKDFYNPEISIKEENTKWLDYLNTLNPTIADNLIFNNVHTNNPNRRAYFFIYALLNQNETTELYKLNKLIETLSQRRNGIAHSLSSISEKDFYSLFTKCQYDVVEFDTIIDRLTGTEGLGVYYAIQQSLIKVYSR